MAAGSLHDIETMQKALRLWSEDMAKAEKASKGIAKNLETLGQQLHARHVTFKDYLKAVLPLPRPLEEASKILVRSNEEIRKSIAYWKDNLRVAEIVGQTETNHYRRMINLEEKRLKLKDSIHAVTGKQLALEYTTIRSLVESLKHGGEINESIIAANSAYKIRAELVDRIYQTQAKTGASLQQLLGAAKALASVWPKTRKDFGDVLQTVIEMEQGLGVSYDNSVQLARVFQLSLKTPVREIADQIAVITNSTSLAADEAARFATEVGKALRLLGPGGAGQIRETTKFVTMLAGRMQDAGGDAHEIVKMFSEMTKGTPEAFMLRGLAGVTPQQIGTEAGSKAAFEGIDRIIKSIVTAAPGSSVYVAQLENASRILNISTETIRLWSDMLKKANEPLDEHAKLQQRWREQTEQANKALHRIHDSIVALIYRGLYPLLPPITKLFGAIADVISFLASHRIAAYAALGVFTVAVTKTIWSLGRLAVTLWQVTAASIALNRAKLVESGISTGSGLLGKLPFLAPLIKEIKIGRDMNLYYQSLGVQKLGDVMRGLSPLSKIGVLLGRLGPMLSFGNILGVGAAGVGGYALGRVIDRTMDRIGDKWSAIFFPVLFGVKKAAETLGKATAGGFNSVTAKQGLPGQLTSLQIMANIRRLIAADKEAEAEQYFTASTHRVKGLVREEGAKGYIDAYKKVRTEMRERAGLTTTIVPLNEQKEFNRRQLELQQESVNRLGSSEKILKDAKDQTKLIEDMRNARTHQDKIQKAAEFRMLYLNDTNTVRKPILNSPRTP